MVIEVKVKKIKLVDARTQLQLTQKGLAQLAHVSIAVISNCENGYPIRRLSAYALLNTLNQVRKDMGLPELEFDQMDWKISG